MKYNKRFFNSVIIICAFLFQTVLISSCSQATVIKKENKIYFTNGLLEKFDSVNAISQENIISTSITAIENDNLILKYIPQDAEIAVINKKNGNVWFSNPVNRNNDTRASADKKAELASQISIIYYTKSGKQKELNSGLNSAKLGQLEYVISKDKLKVNYTLGSKKYVFIIPQILTKERFENSILPMFNDEDEKIVKRRYSLINKDSLADDIKEKTIINYPILDKQPCYMLRDVTDIYKEELEAIFKKGGYTEQDFINDEANNKNSEAESIIPELFNISVEYSLDKDDLVVNVPASEIVVPEGIALQSIKVLPFMGAQDATQQGYIFVPDGSGALIYLNNKKTNFPSYSDRVYGLDSATPRLENPSYPSQIHLPIFGIKNDNGAMLAIIEDGDGVANIEASVAGVTDGYNKVYSSFIIKDSAETFMGAATNKIRLFQNKRYQGNIKLRYKFFDKDNANYSAMAVAYSKYIGEKYSLTKRTTQNNSLVINFIGALDDQRAILGIPTKVTEAVTNYNQAEEIINEFYTQNVKNLTVRYTGWMQGGYKTEYSNKVTFENKVGNKVQNENFIENMKSKNISAFLDVDFQYVYNDTLFDGFNALFDTAKSFLKDDQFKFVYNPANWSASDEYPVVSMNSLKNEVDSFIKSYNNIKHDGFSLRYMGKDLYSDEKSDKEYNRQDSLNEISNVANKMQDFSGKLMLDGINSYLIPYTSYAVNLPTKSSGYILTDESIPFLQMVLSPYLEYTSESVNFNDDPQMSLLSALESGSSLYFDFTYANSNKMKEFSFYDNLYSTDYRAWFDISVKLSQELNKALGTSASTGITGHSVIEKGFTLTCYGEGKRIYVNKTNSDKQYNGNTIKANSYLVIEGGKTNSETK